MPVIRNLILDWSGTLVDDFALTVSATNEVFRRHGKPEFTPDAFREQFFLPFPEFYKRHLPELTMAELERHYRGAFAFQQQHLQLLPHAREFLDYARDGKL